ncbi:MAG: hypothetical protein ACFE8E_14650 [Candidatus Hodarchaeota archaeon]
MDEIKNIIDDMGIDAFESDIKIAAIAVVSDSGDLVYQTSNWDLINQTSVILGVIKGERSFVLSEVEYSVVDANSEGIIGTSDKRMGHILLTFFQGGVLVSYAMPQADPHRALSFLKSYTMKLNGKL